MVFCFVNCMIPLLYGYEVQALRAQAVQLKELLADMMLENRLLKKSVLGDGEAGI